MTTKTLTLRAIDIPSIHKFGIGFDSMLDELMRLTAGQTNTNYPPHNVIKTGEETVTIEIAVAGFGEDELDVKLDNNALIVSGSRIREEVINYEYLHRGLSNRDFTQTFPLAEPELDDVKFKLLPAQIGELLPIVGMGKALTIIGTDVVIEHP